MAGPRPSSSAIAVLALALTGAPADGWAQDAGTFPRLRIARTVNFTEIHQATVYPILHETGWRLEYRVKSTGNTFRDTLRQAAFAAGDVFLAEEPLYGPIQDRPVSKTIFIPTSRLARVPMTAGITLYISPPNKPDTYLAKVSIEPTRLPRPRYIWRLVDLSENVDLARGGRGLRAKVRLYARAGLNDKPKLAIVYGAYRFSRTHRLAGRPFDEGAEHRTVPENGAELSFSFPYAALSAIPDIGKHVFVTPAVDVGGRLETGNISIQIPGKKTVTRRTLESKVEELDRQFEYWTERVRLSGPEDE